MPDPIRDALVAKVEEFTNEDFDIEGMNYRETRAYQRGLLSGAQAALAAYDEAKLAHGDTTEATTIERRKPRFGEPGFMHEMDPRSTTLAEQQATMRDMAALKRRPRGGKK